jgi:hypothetical protein
MRHEPTAATCATRVRGVGLDLPGEGEGGLELRAYPDPRERRAPPEQRAPLERHALPMDHRGLSATRNDHRSAKGAISVRRGASHPLATSDPRT